MRQKSERHRDAADRRLSIMSKLLPSTAEIKYLLARLLLKPPIAASFVMDWSI